MIKVPSGGFSYVIRFAIRDRIFQPGINVSGNDSRLHSVSQGIIRDGIGWSVNRSCLRLLSGFGPRQRNTCLSFRLIITS
jgi:hypothetical protein